MRDQTEQISSLTDSRNRLREELDAVNSKLTQLESQSVPKDRVTVLESKCLEIEQRLDYEKSLHIRFEVCIKLCCKSLKMKAGY